MARKVPDQHLAVVEEAIGGFRDRPAGGAAGIARLNALSTVGSIDLWHRNLAFIVLIVSTLVVLWLLSHRSPLVRWGLVILALVVGQIAIGVFMAYGALVAPAQVAHLTLASLLLGAQTVLWLRSWRQPAE